MFVMLVFFVVEVPCMPNDLRGSSPKWFIQNGKIRETQKNKTKRIFSIFSMFFICEKYSKPINVFYISLFALIICFFFGFFPPYNLKRMFILKTVRTGRS